MVLSKTLDILYILFTGFGVKLSGVYSVTHVLSPVGEGRILKKMRTYSRRQIIEGTALSLLLPLIGVPGPALATVEGERKKIALYGGLLDVDMPVGLEELSFSDMQKVFTAPLPPDYVFSDRLRTSTLAVSIVKSPDPRVDLIAFTTQWGKTLETTVPGFKWVQRRVNRINGRPWITWQYQSQSADGLSETIMFMNILSRDVMIWVNGNAPRALFIKNVADYEAAVRSIDGTLDVPKLTTVKLTR